MPTQLGERPKLTPDHKTIETVRSLGRIQATTREAAAVLDVSSETFDRFRKDYPEAQAAWEDGQQQGKASLRRLQFRQAETNTAMAIFLGKQYLGQSDKNETHHSGNIDMTTTWLVEGDDGTYSAQVSAPAHKSITQRN